MSLHSASEIRSQDASVRHNESTWTDKVNLSTACVSDTHKSPWRLCNAIRRLRDHLSFVTDRSLKIHLNYLHYSQCTLRRSVEELLRVGTEAGEMIDGVWR